MNKFGQRNRKSYNDLVMRVWEIDEEAAIYLIDEAPKLVPFDPCGSLCVCFAWVATPQGFDYWHSISDILYGVN